MECAVAKTFTYPSARTGNLALGPWLCTQKVVDEKRLCRPEEFTLKLRTRSESSGAEAVPEGAPRLLSEVRQAQGATFLGHQGGSGGAEESFEGRGWQTLE